MKNVKSAGFCTYQNMIDQILNLQKENPEETYDELLEKLVTVLEQTVNDTAQNPE